MPKVSLGMPVYNDADLVGAAIASLRAQTITDFELVISDNASTDRTPEVCRALAEGDPRIRYIRQEKNDGQASNFEFTLNASRGEYFAWVCSDDMWDPRFLERLLGALEASTEAIGAFGQFAMTDESRNMVESRFFDYSGASAVTRLLALCRHWDDGHEYGLFRREKLEGLTFPRWFGPNRPSPYEISYPVLFFILARGEILSVEGPPLLFKRRRGGGFHYQAGKGNRAKWYAYKVLLALNLFLASLGWIRRGARSLTIPVIVAPAMAAQIFVQSTASVPGLFRYALGRAARTLLSPSTFERLRRAISARR